MKIVLAYSGGLDTSVLVSWLKNHYSAEIITFAADVGQEEELKGLEDKAKLTGASKHYTLDLIEEFDLYDENGSRPTEKYAGRIAQGENHRWAPDIAK